MSINADMQTQLETISYRGFILIVKEQALMGFYCEVFEGDTHRTMLDPTGCYNRKERAIEITQAMIDGYLTSSI